MAAIVFTIPLIFLVKDTAWGPYYLVMAGIDIVILLVRIFHIARSLEDKIPGGRRKKSASELDITCIENGL